MVFTSIYLSPCSSSAASGRRRVNGVDLYYEQTGRGAHGVLLLPGALGKHSDTLGLSTTTISLADIVKTLFCSATGSTKTDFGPQLKSLNKERFTVVGWDPRGYGLSRPPDRDFPPDFFERDAKDAVDLMKVR